MAHQRGHRAPGDLEVGAADLLIEHQPAHVAPRAEPPRWLTNWEARRPVWLMEMVAEAFGVFIYCWAGMGATAAFFTSVAAKEEGFGSLLTVAFCYGAGIMIAIVIAAPTSGGHLNPCFTIAFALFKGFPWRKVPQYIFAQITGAMVAGLIIYAQFQPALHEITEAMMAGGAKTAPAIFTPQGPAGTIGLFMTPGAKIGIVFVNEFVCTMLLAICVFMILDPSNVFVAPTTGPVLIGLLYFIAVACFGSNGIALNTARDLGARFAVAAIWKTAKAFPSHYTALTVLTNIAATICGALFQSLFLSDTIRPHTEHAKALHLATVTTQEAHLQRQLTTKGGDGFLNRKITPNPPSDSSMEKAHISHNDSPV